MKRASWPLRLVFLGLGLLAAVGIWHLFSLRFERGDVYPAYSSLRADPLGIKVLHDALREIPGLSVQRNFREKAQLTKPEAATVFFAGMPTTRWELSHAERIENLMGTGARLVVTFLPLDARLASAPQKKRKEKKSQDPDDDEPSPKNVTLATYEVASRFGFATAINYQQGTVKLEGVVAEAYAVGGTEGQVSWHSPLYFQKPGPEWTVLYRSEGQAVLMERAWGKGSLVISTDSYFLSNEAMAAERAPQLLAGLLGGRGEVVFDETHLEVEEGSGIVMLARKYKLEGLAAGFVGLALLFVWQTAIPFLPARENEDDDETLVVRGKDATSGFINLLRHGIRPGRLLEVCVEQWKKSFARAGGKRLQALPRMEAAVADHRRHPVQAYRTISQILAEKK